MLLVETDGVMVRYRDRHLDGALGADDYDARSVAHATGRALTSQKPGGQPDLPAVSSWLQNHFDMATA
jgi:hypothetical protein